MAEDMIEVAEGIEVRLTTPEEMLRLAVCFVEKMAAFRLAISPVAKGCEAMDRMEV